MSLLLSLHRFCRMPRIMVKVLIPNCGNLEADELDELVGLPITDRRAGYEQHVIGVITGAIGENYLIGEIDMNIEMNDVSKIASFEITGCEE